MSKEQKHGDDVDVAEDDARMADDSSNAEAAAAAAPASAAATAAADKPAAAASSSTKKGKGKAKKEEVLEVDPNYPGQRFRVGEAIYANYAEGKQWFEAKVLKVEKRKELIYYYLHYQGWSDKYNDWRPYHADEELHTLDDDGKKLFEESKRALKEAKLKEKGGGKAAPAAGEDGKKKTSKRKLDDDATVEDEVSVGGQTGEVKLKISGFLKKQLIQDWEHVTRSHKLVKLPRETTVHMLLQEFENSKQKQESSHQMVKEVVSGVEQYFEKALGTVLLYRFERPQYRMQVAAAAKQNPQTPLSHVYGVEHLLRLFVKLPSLLAYTKLETKEAVVLASKLNDFIRFLSKKGEEGKLFGQEYFLPDGEYKQQVNDE